MSSPKAGLSDSWDRGKRTFTAVPFPISLSIDISPLSSFTKPWVMDRPSPLPATERLRCELILTKGVKSISMSFPAMPIPVSFTSRRILFLCPSGVSPSSVSRSMVIFTEPSSVYLMAFETRLLMTWRSLRSSMVIFSGMASETLKIRSMSLVAHSERNGMSASSIIFLRSICFGSIFTTPLSSLAI